MDRDELRRIVTGLLEKPAHGVRDRDQAARGTCERAIHVAERPQQVAIVVVARRNRRNAEQPRAEAAVDVRVDEMCVHELGALDPNRADDVTRQPRTHVGPAANRPMRHAQLVERRVEARRVAARDVQPEKARVDAALPQSRKEGQQVTLRAADAGQLVEVEDIHLSSGR